MDFQESKEPLREIDTRKYLTLTVSVFFAMLSFFIMLNVISSKNEDKSQQLTKSIKTEFVNKDIKDELTLFPAPKPGLNIYKNNFRDLLAEFLDSNKSALDYEMSENAENYVIKIKYISFFGPDGNEPRGTIENFLTVLDKFIATVRKVDYANASLIIPYEPANKKAANEKYENLYSLNSNKNKNIKYSLIPISDESKNKPDQNLIYLIFKKNEF